MVKSNLVPNFFYNIVINWLIMIKNVVTLFFSFLFMTTCENKFSYDSLTYEKMVTSRNKGLAYLEEENYTEAAKQFEILISLAPSEPLGYANLGLAYMRSDNDFSKSEGLFKKALELSPNNPDIRMLLTLFYELNNNDSLAIKILKETAKLSPDHIQTLYKLSQYYQNKDDVLFKKDAKNLLSSINKIIPSNIVAHLKYIEILLEEGEIDNGLNQINIISQVLPKIPENAQLILNNIIENLENQNLDQARTFTIIFHNLIKPIPFYQSSLIELKGVSGPVSGSPLTRFLFPKNKISIEDNKILPITFDLVTKDHDFKILKENNRGNRFSENKKSLIIDVGDYDLDNDIDIVASKWFEGDKRSHQFFLTNEEGIFLNKTIGSGLSHDERDNNIISFDYNNDGYLDLFILNSKNLKLYKNLEGSKFDIQKNTGIRVNKFFEGTFIDFDIEGDLDLILVDKNKNIVFQNNSNGTFTKIDREIGFNKLSSNSKLITHSDFNNDGDNDIIIIKDNGEGNYFENIRGGLFQQIKNNIGIKFINNPGSVISGDYNNDGNMDLFISDLFGENHYLYMNDGNGFFHLDKNWEIAKKKLPQLAGFDSKFFDFDNDGYLDLLIAGYNKSIDNNANGLLLFHNNRKGSFNDVSNLFSHQLDSLVQVEILDYDNDGDLDIILVKSEGSIELLKNNGGNLNNFVNIKLAGLRTGSGKNNFFGIGSKIELRAGTLYQNHYMNNPIAHFGLGNKDSVDVIRILWSNGVPQNRIKPQQNQTIVEKQILKGSCPYLFLWNGHEYQFATDVLWPSALGMPLGIMAGEPLYAFPNSTDEFLKIPSDILKPKDNKYFLQFTSELWETPYLDKVELLVIDHPENIEIFIDETFSPPPFKPLKIYNIEEKYLPSDARDDRGNNVLKDIYELDKKYLSNLIMDKFQGVTKLHDLILNFKDLDTNDSLFLFLQGWLFPTDASINVNLSQSDNLNSIFPYLQVIDEAGNWKTVIGNIGFPKGKNKTMIIDMTDKFIIEDYRIRIRTNMQIYWDHVFIAKNLLNVSKNPIRLKPFNGDLHYHGFSEIHKLNFSSPHIPIYNSVIKEKRWRDLIGTYTRYGDVTSLLLHSDNEYVIMNSGDEITLQFDMKDIPKLENGWTRDFIFYNDGWLKDGDLNTAAGKTVEPLPFHGMKSYPLGAQNQYPDNDKLSTYRKQYNTRVVDTDVFKNIIKGK